MLQNSPDFKHYTPVNKPTIHSGFDLPISDIYKLIKSIYDSSNTYCASFEEIHPSEQALKNFLDTLNAQQGSLFIVAKDQAQLLGYLFVEPRRQSKLQHTADLNMGIAQNARGKGIGSALLEAALEQTANNKIVEIMYLMVRADNEPATRLYTKHGFETLVVLASDTKIGQNYFDGVLMRKFIRPDA